ncbi:MAG: hypothetical protein ACOC7V_14615, partial [Spirochaetota bacterium]
SIPENAATPQIVPTPGGRYVFFHFREADAAVVVDAETHEVVRALRLPEGSERIQFSSMGDSLYVETSSDRFVLAHRRGEITGGPSAAVELASGRIAFNRRATRVYGERDGALVYALARDGSPVASVGLRGGPYDWQVSPNFRYLLGTSRSGEAMVLVDEARARVVGYLSERFVPGSARFDEASREVHFLTDDGRELAAADVRRFRVSSRLELGAEFARIWRDDGGRLHGLSADDGALILDVTGDPRRVAIDSLLRGSGDLTAAFVELKPGQGFACF